MNNLASILAGGGYRLLVVAALTLGFAGLAWAIRGVTRSGAAAGAVVCFVLYLGAGAGAFLGLITVFLLAWVTTRLGHRRKVRLGTAQHRGGRKASQVLANLALAALCAAAYAASRNPRFLAALVAALAEAAADTVSSEVGQAAGDSARLITSWQMVPAGTDGAVTLAGTLAGFAAAAIVSTVCAGSGLLPWNWALAVSAAAVLGMVADSFLGASLQRRGILNNDWVNLFSTMVAAALAAAIL